MNLYESVPINAHLLVWTEVYKKVFIRCSWDFGEEKLIESNFL